MKRDMDLIRELMLKLESIPLEFGDNTHLEPSDPRLQIADYSVDQIAYHLDLIEQAGFLKSCRGRPAIGVMFSGLSWSGHEFLDSVRNPDVWHKTKAIAAAAGGATIDIIVMAAKTYLQQQVAKLIGHTP